MTMGENFYMRPVLLKVCLAITISLAGFLYTRSRVRKIKSSGRDSEVNSDRAQYKDGLHVIKRASKANSCNIFSYGFIIDADEALLKKMIADSSLIGASPGSKQHKDEVIADFNDLLNEGDIGAIIVGNSSKKDAKAKRLRKGYPPRAYVTPEKDDYDQEIRNLKNKIRLLQERERGLEVQLLDYYDLREREAAEMDLQNRLKISDMEAKMFDLKVENLISENRRLEAQMADHAKATAELESSKAKVKMLKKKIKHIAEQNREQIKGLQQKVSKMQDKEEKAAAAAAVNDRDVQMKLQKLKDLEREAEELKKANSMLQMDNSELSRRLESTQILANSVLEDSQADALREETERLRQENEGLMKEIDNLQADRCSDAEELVYMRWINACLRFELRNYQPPPGKTVARDLSKSLSPESEKKAKQLILEYANSEGIMNFDSDHWLSSHGSSVTDYADGDGFSSVGNSSVQRPDASNKNKFFHKLRRLIKGKHSHSRWRSQDGNSPQSSCSGISNGGYVQRSEFATPNQIYGSSTDSASLKEERARVSAANSTGSEKSPLAKYAEALKNADASSTQKIRRRSASYSSF